MRVLQLRLCIAVFVAVTLSPLSWSWVGWTLPSAATGGVAMYRSRDTATRMNPSVRRQFFKDSWVDPTFWARQTFVAETLEYLLPKPEQKELLVALEIEPTDGRYVKLLKPDSKAFYVDAMIFIGTGLYEASKEDLKKLRNEAVALSAAPRFQSWSVKEKFKLRSNTIDLVLFSDTAVTRLGASFETCLLEAKRVMRDNARMYLIVDEEDEKRLGGKFEEGLKGSMFDRAGFICAAARREHGVVVSCLIKRQTEKTAAGKKKKKIASPKRAFAPVTADAKKRPGGS